MPCEVIYFDTLVERVWTVITYFLNIKDIIYNYTKFTSNESNNYTEYCLSKRQRWSNKTELVDQGYCQQLTIFAASAHDMSVFLLVCFDFTLSEYISSWVDTITDHNLLQHEKNISQFQFLFFVNRHFGFIRHVTRHDGKVRYFPSKHLICININSVIPVMSAHDVNTDRSGLCRSKVVKLRAWWRNSVKMADKVVCWSKH